MNIAMTVLSICTAISCFASATAADDGYYVTFKNDRGVWLMEIDPSGAITRSAALVVTPKMAGFDFTGGAISKNGSNRLTLWGYDDEHKSPIFDDPWTKVARVVVDNRTYKVLSITKTKVRSANLRYIQVTQKKQDNFLGLQKEQSSGNFLLGRDISVTGIFEGSAWLLTDQSIGLKRCNKFFCMGVASADGKFAIAVNHEVPYSTLFLQKLGKEGKPVKDPVQIGQIFGELGGFRAVDITGVLPNNQRWLLYVYHVFDCCSFYPHILYLQPVDASTGETIGDPRIILDKKRAEDVEFGTQGIAVDPAGRFVVLSAGWVKNPTDSLWFQALDENGRRIGPLKSLYRSDSVVDRVDILKQ
jgi:hypothetical protein